MLQLRLSATFAAVQRLPSAEWVGIALVAQCTIRRAILAMGPAHTASRCWLPQPTNSRPLNLAGPAAGACKRNGCLACRPCNARIEAVKGNEVQRTELLSRPPREGVLVDLAGFTDPTKPPVKNQRTAMSCHASGELREMQYSFELNISTNCFPMQSKSCRHVYLLVIYDMITVKKIMQRFAHF